MQWPRFARHAPRALFALCGLCLAPAAFGQLTLCIFNSNTPDTMSFAAINPTSTATQVSTSVNINYTCVGLGSATFSITGLNDTGPNAFRLKHTTQSTQFMPYTVSQTQTATRLTLTGQITAANYQNAYVGSYTDTLTVTISP